MQRLTRLLLVLLVASIASPLSAKENTPAESSEAAKLTIGSQAPTLDIEHWISDGDGSLGPVTEFKEGSVYVVEFWATWCGPCVASMPHLAELQKQYVDRNVTIISVSDEDLDTIEPFLERELRSAGSGSASHQEEDSKQDVEQTAAEDKPKTYGELTSVYCLTTDPDGSTNADYMKAAEQYGIPTAFIVGKSGEVEWIGHPMGMDESLQQIVDDAWDREAFAEKFRIDSQIQSLKMKCRKASRLGDTETLKDVLQQLRTISETEDLEGDAAESLDRSIVYVSNNAIVAELISEPDAGLKALEEVALDAERLMRVANGLTTAVRRGLKPPAQSLSAVGTMLEKVTDASNGMALHQRAQLEYYQGNIDRAIELEEQALETDLHKMERGMIRSYLKEFRREQEEQKELDSEEDAAANA